MQKTPSRSTGAKPVRSRAKKAGGQNGTGNTNSKKICLKELSSRITQMMKEHEGEMTVNDLTDRFLKENTTSPNGEHPWCFRTTQKRIYDVVNTFQSLGIIVKNKTKLSFVPNVGHYKRDLRGRKENTRRRIAEKKAYLCTLAEMRLAQQNEKTKKTKDMISMNTHIINDPLQSAINYNPNPMSSCMSSSTTANMQRNRPYDLAFAEQVKAEAQVRKSRQRLDSEQFLTTATNFTEAGQMTPGRDLATGDTLDDIFQEHSFHYQPDIGHHNDSTMINGFFQSNNSGGGGGYMDPMQDTGYQAGGHNDWHFANHVPQLFNPNLGQKPQLVNPLNHPLHTTVASDNNNGGGGLNLGQNKLVLPGLNTRLPSIDHTWEQHNDMALNGHSIFSTFD
mmetsp:Transcript_40690/g.46785  ORF Transcript_40690/g.46785 Transcript_40690/m.46785 type:complete len:392 (+) Transcript_40690:624-1799(+)